MNHKSTTRKFNKKEKHVVYPKSNQTINLMESFFDSMFLKKEESENLGFENISRYKYYSDLTEQKVMNRLDDPLFQPYKFKRNKKTFAKIFPLFSKLEDIYLETIHKNDHKFDVQVITKPEQVTSSDKNIEYPDLFNIKPPEAQNQTDETLSPTRKSQNNDEIKSEWSPNVQGLFEDDYFNAEQDKDFRLDMIDSKYTWGTKSMRFLEDVYSDMCDMQHIDFMLDYCEKEKMAPMVFSNLPEAHLDIIELNSEEMNYNGKKS